MATLEAKKKKLNETDVDRQLEDLSVKFLSGNASPEDQEGYAKLMNWRRSRLVKLQSVKLRSRSLHKRLAG